MEGRALLPLLGLADHDSGPVLIAWDAATGQRPPPAPGPRRRPPRVRPQTRRHRPTYVVDGNATPPPAGGRPPLARGLHPRVRAPPGRGGVAPRCGTTAPTDPGEFFAVATEAFFDLPLQLEEAKPELYEVLSRLLPPGSAARAPPEWPVGPSRAATPGGHGRDLRLPRSPHRLPRCSSGEHPALPQGRQPGRARDAGADLPGSGRWPSSPCIRGGSSAGSAPSVLQRSSAGVHPPPGARRSPLEGEEPGPSGSRKSGEEKPSALDHADPADLVWNWADKDPRPSPSSGTGKPPTRSSSTGPTPRRRRGSRPGRSRPSWRRTGLTSSSTSSILRS